MYEIQGKIHVIFDTQQVTERFRKREFVLETTTQYPEYIKFQLTQDRCAYLDTFSKGDEAKVRFTLKGKPYQKANETLYFTNIEALDVQALSKSPAATAEDFPPPPTEEFFNDMPSDSPLPF